jgi:hypothetical protein
MKQYTVRVSNALAGRVDNVQHQLRKLGVTVTMLRATAPRPQTHVVRRYRPSRSGRIVRSCKTAQTAIQVIGHVWLAFSILEKAIGYWPQIKKILVDAGLTRDQITTLGLSQAMRQPKSRKKSKTRVR